MASVKLTDYMRSEIVNRAVKHAFEKREAKLAGAADKLAVRVMRHALGTKLYNAMMDLPEAWFPTAGTTRVSVCGAVEEFKHSKIRVPYSKHGYSVVADAVERGDPLAEAIETQVAAVGALRADREALTAKIKGILNTVTTTGRLLEVWPEVEPFLPAIAAPVDRTVPAVLITAINEEIGLPLRGAEKLQAEMQAA